MSRTLGHAMAMAMALALAAVGCDGDDGAKGAPGDPGGTGDSGSPGEGGVGEAGTACSVKDNGDGTKTITCPDGTTVTIPIGSGCTVVSLSNACKRIICEDGSTEVVCAPPSPKANMSAVHDPASLSYDSACLTCHIDKLTEKSLSASVPGFHAVKMGADSSGNPIIPGATPDDKCVFCHVKVDMSPNRSAGNTRRNVAVSLCAGCHTSSSPDFYLP